MFVFAVGVQPILIFISVSSKQDLDHLPSDLRLLALSNSLECEAYHSSAEVIAAVASLHKLSSSSAPSSDSLALPVPLLADFQILLLLSASLGDLSLYWPGDMSAPTIADLVSAAIKHAEAHSQAALAIALTFASMVYYRPVLMLSHRPSQRNITSDDASKALSLCHPVTAEGLLRSALSKWTSWHSSNPRTAFSTVRFLDL